MMAILAPATSQVIVNVSVASSGAARGDPASRLPPSRKWITSIRLDFPAAFRLPVAEAASVRRTETMLRPGRNLRRLKVGREGLQSSCITAATFELAPGLNQSRLERATD